MDSYENTDTDLGWGGALQETALCPDQKGKQETHFLNPKFFQSSLIFICSPGLFSASWCFLFWTLPGFLLRPLTLAGTRGLILVVERESVELDLHSPGTWREIRIVVLLFCLLGMGVWVSPNASFNLLI